MNAPHTPGPWHYKFSGFRITIGNESTRHDYLEHDFTVCRIDDNSMQAEANARLIAAAPEQNEALCEALAWWHSSPSRILLKEPAWLGKARAALAKAGGQP